MRLTRAEAALALGSLAAFLGPICLPQKAPPGRPEQGMAVARLLLEEILQNRSFQARNETFIYGHTPEEPAEYSYAVFSRDLNNGFYDLDVQIRWKAIPDTKTSKGSRRMEIHLGQLVEPAIEKSGESRL